MFKNLKNKELYSNTDIISFLAELLEITHNLEIELTPTYLKKIELIKQMYKITSSRQLPTLDSNSDWCYQIQCTMFALYLNMVPTSKKLSLLQENEKYKWHGYNLIQLSGKYLTITQFATLNKTTEGAIRQQIRNGLLPYAKKFGSAWLIPEFSRPIKDSELIGWFNIQVDIDAFITSTGSKIMLPKHSAVNVLSKGRTNENKKFFDVIVNKYDSVTENTISSIHYELNLSDKNKFLFYLINNPNVNYHSSDIGLTTWLLS